jgi:heme-degrading monooxygenase HmoA
MFARIGIWEGSEEELEKWIVRSREHNKPNIVRDAGLKAVYWLADRSAGKGMIVTLWQSEQAMKASEAAALKRQSGTKASTGAKVTTERYEVVDTLVMPGD